MNHTKRLLECQRFDILLIEDLGYSPDGREVLKYSLSYNPGRFTEYIDKDGNTLSFELGKDPTPWNVYFTLVPVSGLPDIMIPSVQAEFSGGYPTRPPNIKHNRLLSIGLEEIQETIRNNPEFLLHRDFYLHFIEKYDRLLKTWRQEAR